MTKEINRVSVSHISNMHNQWLRSLNFYKTEMGILKGLLTEIAGKNTGSEAAKEIEHFENQFKVQTNNIDILCHEIHVNIAAISKEAQSSSAGYVDGKLLTDHAALGRQADDQEKATSELIHSFRRFAQMWL